LGRHGVRILRCRSEDPEGKGAETIAQFMRFMRVEPRLALWRFVKQSNDV
jgi:serine/threonine protein kinase HipA of HipAB toxin-antitoxin module